jgi:hypothetical protein
MRKKKCKECVFDANDVMYYYVRNDGHRVGVVALFVVPPTCRKPGARAMYCRGISICSVNDQFDAQKGKGEALGRCRKAFYSRTNQEPITNGFASHGGGRAISILRFANNYTGYKPATVYKAAYTSRISDFEKKIVEGHKKAALGIVSMGAIEKLTRKHPYIPLLTGEMREIRSTPMTSVRTGPCTIGGIRIPRFKPSIFDGEGE